MFNKGSGIDDSPYNPRYAPSAQGSSCLATIPEDGPPPAEDLDQIAFPEGPQKDESGSVSSDKVDTQSRPYCGK